MFFIYHRNQFLCIYIFITLGLTSSRLPIFSNIVKQKGISFGDWENQITLKNITEVDESLNKLKSSTNAAWVSIYFQAFAEDPSSPNVYTDPLKTTNGTQLTHLINTAHSLGLKVMVKPHIILACNFLHIPSTCPDGSKICGGQHCWRGIIGKYPAFSDNEWTTWFSSYKKIITYYASIASNAGAESFSVGCELPSTASRDKEWRQVIASVRNIFNGTITYSSHTSGTYSIGFWDAVDFIGIDAYMQLMVNSTKAMSPSVADFTNAWSDRGYIDQLATLSNKFEKKIVFTEVGYSSSQFCGVQPYEVTSQILDMQCQANAYEAVLKNIWKLSWFGGAFWWTWRADINAGGTNDLDLTPMKKPASLVLAKYYE